MNFNSTLWQLSEKISDDGTVNYSCNSKDEALDLREVCVESDTPPESCFPKVISLSMSNFVGIWCALHAILGSCGNLLTILSVPLAIKQRRHGLHDNWQSTAFILNLSVADFLYCFFGLPFQATLYLLRRWPFGKIMCALTGTLRLTNAFADWMSLGVIAVNRCLSISNPDLCARLSTKRNVTIVIASIWIYSFLLLIPIFSGLGDFGYNCRLGICGFHSTVKHFSEIYFYGLGFFMPCLMSAISYSIAWVHVRKFKKIVSPTRDEECKKMNKLEIQVTWTMALVCFCYVLFVSPICLLRIVDVGADLGPKLHVIVLCIYWCQYSFNFYIYALRCQQYRKAYVDFIITLKKEFYKRFNIGQEESFSL